MTVIWDSLCDEGYCIRLVSISQVLSIFDDQEEFAIFLPTAAFAYIYHLSREPSYILAAVVFGVLGSGAVAVSDEVSVSAQYGDEQQLIGALMALVVFVYGFPLAIVSLWINTISANLPVPPIVGSLVVGQWDIFLKKVVPSPDLILLVLLGLNSVYFLMLVMPLVTLALAVLVDKLRSPFR